MEIHRNAYFRTFNPFVVGSTPAGPTKFKPRKSCRKNKAYGVFCYIVPSSVPEHSTGHQNRRCKLTETQVREDICRIGQSLFERGYVHATAGNISVKLDAEQGGGYLITPTDACLGFLDPARLARLDADSQQQSGDRASKTIVLHQQIYAASAGSPTAARCIIHTHSTHCVALTLNPMKNGQTQQPTATQTLNQERIQEYVQELLPALTPYFVMKVGHVPLIDYRRPGDPQAAQAVAAVIARYQTRGTPIRAVMLARLGPNVWHDSPAAAMATLEELEETAKLWQLTQGAALPLQENAIAELRQTFGAFW